jgi:hypothetical protein
LEDFSIWYQQFGKSTPPGSSASAADAVALASDPYANLRDEALIAWLASEAWLANNDFDDTDVCDECQSPQKHPTLAISMDADIDVSVYDVLETPRRTD